MNFIWKLENDAEILDTRNFSNDWGLQFLVYAYLPRVFACTSFIGKKTRIQLSCHAKVLQNKLTFKSQLLNLKDWLWMQNKNYLKIVLKTFQVDSSNFNSAFTCWNGEENTYFLAFASLYSCFNHFTWFIESFNLVWLAQNYLINYVFPPPPKDHKSHL